MKIDRLDIAMALGGIMMGIFAYMITDVIVSDYDPVIIVKVYER